MFLLFNNVIFWKRKGHYPIPQPQQLFFGYFKRQKSQQIVMP